MLSANEKYLSLETNPEAAVVEFAAVVVETRRDAVDRQCLIALVPG